MNKSIFIKCLLIAVLCGITATGQPGHSSEGKIIGRVIERETLQSLAAEISIAGRDGRNLFLRHTRALEDGLFEVAGLPAGELRLTTKLDGYATDHMNVSLSDGETRYVEFYLIKGKTVSGVVYDQSNTPVTGARVNVAYLRDATDASSVTASYQWEEGDTVTDQLGRFEISDLHPEKGFIIEASHHKFLATISAPMRFGPRDRELSLNLSIGKGLAVVGVVRDADKNILRGARVMLLDAGKSDYSRFSQSESMMYGRTHTLSNEDGSFSFDQVRPTKMALIVLHPSYQNHRQIIDLTGRQTPLSIDVTLQNKN